MMKIYKPVPGKGFVWGIAMFAFALLISALPLGLSLGKGRPDLGFLLTMGIVLVFTAGLIGYFAWAAKNLHYELTDRELIIRWAFNKKIIPLESIKGVSRTVGTSSMKVIGASWPGFHFGSFTSPTGKGSVNMYGTRLWGEILLIRTRWETIGITPEDSEEFLGELNRLRPGLVEGDTAAEPEAQETFSPWKDKVFLSTIILSGIIFVATGLFLAKTIPTLPDQVPMHYNFAGEVDRYGSPREIYIPFGIGVVTDVFLVGITAFVARNNKASMYMTGFTSVFLALIFSVISISMVFASK